MAKNRPTDGYYCELLHREVPHTIGPCENQHLLDSEISFIIGNHEEADVGEVITIVEKYRIFRGNKTILHTE